MSSELKREDNLTIKLHTRRVIGGACSHRAGYRNIDPEDKDPDMRATCYECGRMTEVVSG